MRVYKGVEAKKVHEYKKEQDKIDNLLAGEHRRRLRNALKYNLKRHSDAFTDHQGNLKEWFMRKLDCMAAYGMADWTGVTERQGKIAKAYFFEGANIRHLSLVFAVSQRQVQKEIAHVLNQVIDTAPKTLLRMLDFSIAQYIIHGCTNCGDTLEWDSEGAHLDLEGEYLCLHCGRRYSFDLKPIS